MLGFQVHPVIASPRTLKKTRYSKGEQRITKPTTLNACITNWCTLDNIGTFMPNNNPTLICLIKHTQEHMEGGNYLRTDVVRCLTPFPCITKSPNPSLIPDPVFMHILIKIIKPVDIGDQSHLKFPDDWWRLQISCYLLPLPYPQICRSTHTHTHTLAHVYTIYSPQYITHMKWDSVEPNGGWSWET